MDEAETDDVVTVGQSLREAREAKGLTVEDIAAQTRIPTRHLASLESSDWTKLPAATYSIGFAKNYASAVGLDRNEIGDRLRAEMGGTRPLQAHPEVYETVDPARTMPKGLVFGALGLLALVVLALTWLSNRSLETEEPVAEAANVAVTAENVAATATPPAEAAAVVLTAIEPVWIEIKDGSAILKQGQLAPGETYAVPANATAPVLTTGKPEALGIRVGAQQAPPIGRPGTRVSGVSLKGADLIRPAAAASPPAASPPAATGTAAAPSTRPRPAPPPAETPDPVQPGETGNGEPAPDGQAASQ